MCVLSLAGCVQGALGRLCAGDKGDSSVFECCVFVCVCEHVCALEACASMFGVCTSEHLNQHVNKSGHMCPSACYRCGHTQMLQWGWEACWQ